MQKTSEVMERLFTPSEVAAAMNVSKMTVYRLIKSGAIKAVRIGRQWRVPASALVLK